MSKKMLLLLTGFFCCSIFVSFAQEDLLEMIEQEQKKADSMAVNSTFKTTRIINAHSVEVLKQKELDFRITHRFGDIAGGAGGVHTLYGFDAASDIRFSFEYGLLDRLNIGVGRSKGVKIKEIYDGFLKYQLLNQSNDNKTPVSLTFFSNVAFSGMKKSASNAETDFLVQAHRLSYVFQVLLGRRFSERLSLQVMPIYLHRNLVAWSDNNDIYGLGVGGRMMLTKRFGIISDYYYILNPNANNILIHYTNPLSIGFEMETGGHVFHLNFTNSTGILENEFIPYTSSSWLKGEYRFGFNISRVFSL
jgi:hypothetical protein